MKKTITLIFTSLLFQLSFAQYTDYYWVGGSGDVSDYANHWATTSGGGTFHVEEPDSDSNLIFDSNSFSSSGQTVSLSAGLFCHDFLAKNTTNSPSFEANSNSILIYGSYSLNPSSTYDFTEISFRSTGSETIDLGGLTIPSTSSERWAFESSSPTSTWEIISDAQFEANFIDVSDGFFQIASGVTFTTTRMIRLKSGTTLLNFGTLIFDSGSYLFNEAGSGISGNDLTFKKNTTFGTSDGKYSIVGSPITSASTSTLGNIVYSYDESQDFIGNDGLDRFIKITSPETMTPGKGYFSANTGTITVSGIPNSGTIDVDLDYTTSASTEGDYDGFNLVANPYPTTLRASTFLDANGSGGSGAITDVIYLWVDGGSNSGRRSSSDYMSVNFVGRVGGPFSRAGDYFGWLGSFQGFFVKATGTGQTLTFTEAMRDTEWGDDDNFFRKASEEIFKIRVNLENETLYSETLIGFLDDATKGFDPKYDAKNILGAKTLNLSSLIDNEAYSIQGRPISLDPDNIALSFDTEYDGLHKLSFGFENMPSSQTVSLYDTYTSKTIDLNVHSTYEFTSKSGSFADRFSLMTGINTITSIENLLDVAVDYSFSANGVSVKSANPLHTISIYNFQGKMIDRMTFDSKTKERFFKLKNQQERLIIIRSTDFHGKSDVQKFQIK